jgi:hypothetical protein
MFLHVVLHCVSPCRAAKQRFDEDEEFKVRAREAVTRLQVRAHTPGTRASVQASSRKQLRLWQSLQQRSAPASGRCSSSSALCEALLYQQVQVRICRKRAVSSAVASKGHFYCALQCINIQRLCQQTFEADREADPRMCATALVPCPWSACSLAMRSALLHGAASVQLAARSSRPSTTGWALHSMSAASHSTTQCSRVRRGGGAAAVGTGA